MAQHSHQHASAAAVVDHRARVRAMLEPLLRRQPETVSLTDALGRGLAEDVQAPLSLPPFANSQMDGFAVRSADLADGGAELEVAAPIPAGAMPARLLAGTAAPIMTGAVLPEGADAVVPIERATPDSFPAPGSAVTVRLPATPVGMYVRHAGSDIPEGATGLVSGTFLGARQLGLLAALGIPSVPVHRRVRVLLVTTGDEVVAPGDILPPGKIYDANATLLAAAMREAGLDVLSTGISSDNPEHLAHLLRSHQDDVDLVVTTGGVSKGAYEVVRQALADEPVEFLHVAMQPGGPQGVGTVYGLPFLGFPGNSVSCLISFEMLLRPVLADLFGSPQPRTSLRATLSEDLVSPDAKHQIRRGILSSDGTIALEGGQESHLVSALARSNALVHIPVGTAVLRRGEEVEVWML